MTRMIRAAVLVKPKTIEFREFARPAVGRDDALLRIKACGICYPLHIALVPGVPRVPIA